MQVVVRTSALIGTHTTPFSFDVPIVPSSQHGNQITRVTVQGLNFGVLHGSPGPQAHTTYTSSWTSATSLACQSSPGPSPPQQSSVITDSPISQWAIIGTRSEVFDFNVHSSYTVSGHQFGTQRRHAHAPGHRSLPQVSVHTQQDPHHTQAVTAAVQLAQSDGHARGLAEGIAMGMERFASAVRSALADVAQGLVVLHRGRYEALRRRLGELLDVTVHGIRATATLPTWASVQAETAQRMLAGPLRHSYGHRALKAECRAKRERSCLGQHCPNDRASACPHSLCALCCDKHFQQQSSDHAVACLRHQPRGLPSTLGVLIHDGYLAQVDDGCAWLEGFLNGEGQGLLRPGLQGGTITIDGVLWVDGGRSCGTTLTQWCLVLNDDQGKLFRCSVSELTRASFHPFITAKTKCNAAGLTKVVGPLLRTVIDMGMYGAVHQASQTCVKVIFRRLVADMDALVQLV